MDKNQKDVEIVLRLFSLFEAWQSYEKPMLGYLNKQMRENRDFTGDRANRFRERFPKVVDLLCESVLRPFRPRGVINVAILDSVMIALLEDETISAEQLTERYKRLIEDDVFNKYIGGATTDTQIVRERIKNAKRVLSDAAV